MLLGFGDARLGEWTEDREQAFHLRRRLTHQEQETIGEAIDCRKTDEGQRRYDAIKRFLPEQALYLVQEEVPTVQL